MSGKACSQIVFYNYFLKSCGETKFSGILMSIFRCYICFVLLLFSATVFAQKKISTDISFGLRKSFSDDQLKTYITEPALVSVEYYSRKKFKHPYFNLLANVSYPIVSNLKLGLQSGIYVHYLERYSAVEKTASVSVPLQLTGRYTLWKVKNNFFGIDAAAGLLFFSIDGYSDKYKNAALLNVAVFYSKNNEGLLKFGIEKEVDYVTTDLKQISQYSPEDIFKYSIKKLSVAISYGIIIR